jgi:hypothetical protein
MNVANITDLLPTPEERYGNEQTGPHHHGNQNDEGPLGYGVSDTEHGIAFLEKESQSVVSRSEA